MDKRYQVFVSSTFEDLQDERKEVMQALLELDCIPAGMELFPASHEDQWTLIKRVIDDCDYYIVIIGGRYGSTNKAGLSYTEMEYRYALEKKMPIVAFLHKNPEDIKSRYVESTDRGKRKLQEFRKLAETKMVKYWSNPSDLGGVVSRSMINLKKQFPAIGWIKADNEPDSELFKEILKLQKENEALKDKLHESSMQAPPGTENLAQGEDTFEFELVLTVNQSQTVEKNKLVLRGFSTWNTLFASVAPHIIPETTDVKFKNQIIKHFANVLSNELENYEVSNPDKNIKTYSISDVIYQKIKIQFRALGFIKEKTLENDKCSCHWVLTEYGDYKMNQIIAEKHKST